MQNIIESLLMPLKSDDYTVSLPRFLLVIGIVCSCVFLIPAVIILLTEGFNALALIFIGFCLLGVSLIVGYINCRIWYTEESFEVKNFWGIKRRYSYSDITGIQGKHMDVKLFVGKHIVCIDALAVGKYAFLSYAKKQYRKNYDGNPIPTVKPKTDIFHGNVERPGEFVFIYVLIGLICVGTIVFFAVVSSPKTNEDLEHASLFFVRYEIEEDHLRLYTDSSTLFYDIPAYKELLTDATGFISQCEAGASFSVSYATYNNADIPHYGLESITGQDGTIYLTMDAVHNYRWGDAWAFYLIFGGLAVIWFAFVFISIYVGRHPEKFSQKFIRLFFKDGYIRVTPKSKMH